MLTGTNVPCWEWERTGPPPAPEHRLLAGMLFRGIVDALQGDAEAGRWVEEDGPLVARYLGMDAAADRLKNWRTTLQLPPLFWERPKGRGR